MQSFTSNCKLCEFVEEFYNSSCFVLWIRNSLDRSIDRLNGQSWKNIWKSVLDLLRFRSLIAKLRAYTLASLELSPIRNKTQAIALSTYSILCLSYSLSTNLVIWRQFLLKTFFIWETSLRNERRAIIRATWLLCIHDTRYRFKEN